VRFYIDPNFFSGKILINFPHTTYAYTSLGLYMPKTHKICSYCKIEKPMDEFHKRNSKKGYRRQARCKVCMNAYSASPQQRESNLLWRQEMRTEIDNGTEKGIAHVEYRLYNAAKHRAKNTGIEFTISRSDVRLPTHCPVLGIPIVSSPKVMTASSPTLDRLDPAKGYVPGNVNIISNKANCIKNSATIDEVYKVWEWMRDNL
jgi:hypothetical protein